MQTNFYKIPEYLVFDFVDGFSSSFKTPCIVFTSHPSLRFGDAVHFMEMWGKSGANTVIFTGNST